MRILRRATTLLCISVGTGAAQTAPVPAAYQSVYTELQGKLATFDSAISAKWNKSAYPTQFSGELLYANSNSGLQLLSPGVVAKYRTELNALKGLGVKAVVVKMGYPLLSQPFLQFNGDPNDYAAIIAFYRGVTNDIHAAGLKVIVESTAIFPGFFSTGSGLNVTGWYSSIGYNDLVAGYAAMNATIATQIGPDYINVGSEPDTEAKNTGYAQFNTPDGWAAAVSAFISQIPPGSGVQVGAGLGTWIEANGQQFLQSLLTKTKLDYIDFHVYPINTPMGSSLSIIQNSFNLIDQAAAAGKPVAISEAWLLKTSDANYQQANASTDPATFSFDTYSFFAPLDQAFLQSMWKLSNWKQLLYMSAFWSRYFWAYLDYSQVSALTPAQVTAAAEQAAGAALQAGQITSTGQFYKNLVSASAAGPALVSSASLKPGPVASASLVSVFGTGFGANPTVTVQDSAGVQRQATVSYASATQVNAALPAGMANGIAGVGVGSLNGSLTVASIAPGIFSADASGAGVAAAEIVTTHSDGSNSFDYVFTCGSVGGCVPKPIVVNAPGDTVFLILFGTGWRNRSSLANTTVYLGTQAMQPVFAGAQTTYAGLDQINVALPAALAGAGLVNVVVSADGARSNAVTVRISN